MVKPHTNPLSRSCGGGFCLTGVEAGGECPFEFFRGPRNFGVGTFVGTLRLDGHVRTGQLVA